MPRSVFASTMSMLASRVRKNGQHLAMFCRSLTLPPPCPSTLQEPRRRRGPGARPARVHGFCGSLEVIAGLLAMKLDFSTYRSDGFYDELIDAQGVPRPWARTLIDYLSRLDGAELNRQREAVDAAIMTMGITFTLYGD